ncbi:MAG TPA: CDP-diacylglycerol--glycerol-3-phosphate 3-phosphatidyltransferase [Vicinamibacterales bacterium]|nr:CDP-diacylglycerol--glycerol-3-phosphate 3-phosphatidyltransferase [Vicinamibacterales bacterium]
MNLPNALTLGRIFLVPLLVVVLMTQPDGRQLFGVSWQLLGAAIFGIAAFTDWLDGFIARRRHQVTNFGQWLDPLADKLLVTAALISLVQLDFAPAWMVAVILGRELAVTVLRSMAHGRGYAMPASPLGKLKLIAQVTAIEVLILGHHHLQDWVIIGNYALWVATIAAVVSAIDYWRRFKDILAGRAAPLPEPEAVPSAEARKRVSA